MSRHLLLLRHAKSAWDTDAPDDFGRPLAKRGKKDALRMGQWMHGEGLVPGYILSSPALRARETSYRVCKALGLSKRDIRFDPRLYLADVKTLLALLAEAPGGRGDLMLVGHNPGMEELLGYLWGENTAVPEDGKLLPTASLARLTLPDDWKRLDYGCARRVRLTRPRSLPRAAD
jgi:phosphohistidine phosphatase